MTLIAPYLLELCHTAQESGFSFGLATRLGTQSSTFNIDATKVIHSIITFSPARESVAIGFLHEFRKVPCMNHLVELVLSGQSELDVHHWVQQVLKLLKTLTSRECSMQLAPVLNLTIEYLSHLLVAIRNPGGKKTPQTSAFLTPQIVCTQARIQQLIEEAVINQEQSSLKLLMYARDGYKCPLSDFSFNPQADYVVPRCAHILPFSLGGKKASRRIIETFTGKEISAETILENINHPRNAFNVQTDARDAFDALSWGIEAISVDGKWKYLFRKVAHSSPTIRRKDGDELNFNNGTSGDMIDGPDPKFCNLKLAIARALHACGAAGIIAEIYGDDDDDEAIVTHPVYFGGPFVSDEVLCRRLDDILNSYS